MSLPLEWSPTLSMTTLSMTTLSMTTLSIITFSIMTGYSKSVAITHKEW